MSKTIQYKTRPLAYMEAKAADQFFSKKEKSGLYFSTKYYRNGPNLSELQTSFDELFLYDQNQYAWKRVERREGKEMIRFDSFEPLDNLEYFIFSRDEAGDGYIHHMKKEWPHTYENVAQLAAQLSTDQQVILAEQQVRAFRVDERCAAAHPFSPENTGEKRYFFRRSYGSFSRLCPQASDIDSLADLNAMTKYFPMGHANLDFFERLSLFSRGEWLRFAEAAGEVTVLDRDRFTQSFASYAEAKAFVEGEQAKSTHGVEYLIAKLAKSHYWH